MHVIVESPEFVTDSKAAGLSDDERVRVIDRIALNPLAGDVIKGTGAARKVRFAGRGKGKSGGFRVITFYAGPDLPVFLITVFGKGEKVDLTHAERNALRKELAHVADSYRRGVRLYVGSR